MMMMMMMIPGTNTNGTNTYGIRSVGILGVCRDDDGDGDGDHLETTSCSKAWDLSSGGGTGGQHDSLPKASQHKPIIC